MQYFLFLGFAGLMFVLRLDARRFGAAEWDTEQGTWRVWAPRISWYVAGLALSLLIFGLHPSPVSELNLTFAPDRGVALFLGLLYGLGGTLVAFGVAWIRGGRLRFPVPERYPGGVLSSIGTAYFDEFLFRGVILGLLLGLGVADWVGVVAAAILYAGTVRASSAGRGLLDTAVALIIGLASGLVVLLTAGIAGAIVGHAITRFALLPGARSPDPHRAARGRYPTGRSSTSSRRPPGRPARTRMTAVEDSVRSDPPEDAWAPAAPEGLYVHVPFCVSVCPYCDFVVYGGADARGPRNRVAALVEALHRELELRVARLPDSGARRPLTSVYLGGGTPSLLAPATVAEPARGRRRPPRPGRWAPR